MYLAIDLGGTKTLIGVMDETGKVVNSIKFPTPAEYTDFLTELKTSIVALINPSEIKAACMAIPGTVNRESGTAKHLGNLGWPENIPIQVSLSEYLNCPIFIENDANLAGLAEAMSVNSNFNSALYVTVSTGIGGGYIVNGKLNEGTIDAEIGHMVFNYEGTLTEWEDFASGTWIVKTYNSRASELEDQEAWLKISENIAVGMINLIYSLTPEVIIIGGGVGAHLYKFETKLKKALNRANLSGMINIPPIVKAQHPEEAVIYGCYHLIKQSITQ